MIRPLLGAFKEAAKGLVIADCVTTSKELDKKLEEANWVFQEGEELVNEILKNQEIFIIELLRYFGPGKKPISVALRRAIAAYNAGEATRRTEVFDEYKAIASVHDVAEISHALKNQSPQALMQNFPSIMERHFSLANQPLKELAIKILHSIFEKTRGNTTVHNALDQLRKKAGSEKELPEAVEKFIFLVFEEARIDPQQLKEWTESMNQRMLQTTFKKTVCNILSLVAQNIRMLKLLFEEKRERAKISTEEKNEKLRQKKIEQLHMNLFVACDETFLSSESQDCVAKKVLHKDLVHQQSVINYKRKKEERIALIALKAGDTRSYQQLVQEEELFKWCFDTQKRDMAELQSINNSGGVQELNTKHNVRIVAVPIAITDHPFKDFREYEDLIKVGAFVGATLLRPFLPRMIEPKLLQILPKMEGKKRERFNVFTAKLLDLLLDPIYDGAIGDTNFRPVFERIITTKGEALAEALENLLKEPELILKKFAMSGPKQWMVLLKNLPT